MNLARAAAALGLTPRRRRIGLALALALGLHGAFALIRVPTPEKPPAPVWPKEVHIRIMTAQKPLPPAAPAAPSPQLSPTLKAASAAPPKLAPQPAAARAKAKPKANKTAPQHAAATAPAAQPMAYSELLPDANFLPAEGEAETDTAPRASPRGLAVADRVAGVLDIPLAYRATGVNEKATAKLVRRPGSEVPWVFASIDGDPLLRAALFEGLRDPSNRRLILALFHDLESEEVLIALRQSTEQKDGKGGTYADHYEVQGHKLVIVRVRYVDRIRNASSVLGDGLGKILRPISLPDREAERAQERDHGALARLERSPAYLAPIRDREP